MTTIYAIKTVNGSWYETHGRWGGSGCLRKVPATFPPRYYETVEDAREMLAELIRDFPDEAKSEIIEIEYALRPVAGK